jgi:hypothetical protein
MPGIPDRPIPLVPTGTAPSADSGVVREHDGLGPVTDVELGEDVCHVGLGGAFADHQPRGDLEVGVPVRHETEDLLLPRRELVEAGLEVRARRTEGEPVDHGAGHRRVDDGASRGDVVQRGEDAFRRGLLKKEGTGTLR